MKSDLKLKGWFTVRCLDPDGGLAWEGVFDNAVTSAALNDILSVYFNAGTQKTAWYMGLIDNVGFTALQASDTMAAHSGWTENQVYGLSTRPQWSPGAPSGGQISNPTAINFAINGNCAIKGAFLCSDPTKGGTAGILWAEGLLSAVQNLINGQVLQLSYTCPANAT